MSTSNRNKQVHCPICYKSIRSDTQNRHARTHKSILTRPEVEWREELKDLRAVYKERENKVKRLEEIAHEEDVPDDILINIIHPSPLQPSNIETLSQNEDDGDDDDDDEKHLKESMQCDMKEYLDKIDLGRRINAILDEGEVPEESLKKHRKDALNLYRKQKPTRDMLEVELHPWQQELKTIVETPTEREIIWVQGVMGNEGKTWFQDYLSALYGYTRVVRLDL